MHRVGVKKERCKRAVVVPCKVRGAKRRCPGGEQGPEGSSQCVGQMNALGGRIGPQLQQGPKPGHGAGSQEEWGKNEGP